MPELFPVQIAAVEKIRAAFAANKHKGFILADGMGIGKTAPAITLIKGYASAERPALVLCPAFLLYNWIDELELWGVPSSDVCVCDSRDQILEKKKIYLAPYSRIALETYTTPKTGEEKKRPNNITRQLLALSFSLVVCDEAHTLKTWNSQRSGYIS